MTFNYVFFLVHTFRFLLWISMNFFFLLQCLFYSEESTGILRNHSPLISGKKLFPWIIRLNPSILSPFYLIEELVRKDSTFCTFLH